MDWTSLVRWQLHRRQWDELIERIAERCRRLILERVSPQIASMRPSEAQGYVRARSGGAVASQTALIVAEWGLPRELAPALVPVAKEEAIRLVVADLRSCRQSAPVRRRAA